MLTPVNGKKTLSYAIPDKNNKIEP